MAYEQIFSEKPPTPQDGYVFLWRAINGPISPDNGSGVTFTSNNGSLAQAPELPKDLGFTEAEFDLDYDPLTRVDGLPVFLNPDSAFAWLRNSERTDAKEIPEYVGGVAVVACAKVPVTLFESGVIEVNHNTVSTRGGAPQTRAASVSTIAHSQNEAYGLTGEHSVPNYPHDPESAGIRTTYYLPTLYRTSGNIAVDAQLMEYDAAALACLAPERQVVTAQELESPSFCQTTGNAEQYALQSRDADPYFCP